MNIRVPKQYFSVLLHVSSAKIIKGAYERKDEGRLDQKTVLISASHVLATCSNHRDRCYIHPTYFLPRSPFHPIISL